MSDHARPAARILRPQPISGFPEWLPELRRVELAWLDRIRATFESYGFCPIETPAVEALEVLLAKGETDKEIYVLNRLQAEPGEAKEAHLALHFDQTVPLARYVAQHFNDLVFPFKRWQIQKVWRGERPQAGRFREFYQCDIDVLNVDTLPLHFDVEMPAIMHRLLTTLDVGPFRLHVSNRKILEGYLRGLGLTQPQSAIRILDKRDKLGEQGVAAQLTDQLGLPAELAARALALARIATPDGSFAVQVQALGVEHPLLAEGLTELGFVMDGLAHLPRGDILADLAIARGFDYYTGTVFEGRLTGFPDYGSIVAGGRYDDLAGSYISKRLPGVGISLGLTRLFAKMVAEGRVAPGRPSPTEVLVVLPAEERRAEVAALAEDLRNRGLCVEMFHSDAKLKRQLTYAERKGIPYVWFPPLTPDGGHEVKDMASGVQAPADPAVWRPAA